MVIDMNNWPAAMAWRVAMHKLIRSETYDQAEAEISAVLKACQSRAYDGVLDEDITSSISDLADLIAGWTRSAMAVAPTTALSLDFETEGDEWCVAPFGYSDDVYPFSTSTLAEVRDAVDANPWGGGFHKWDADKWDISGFESCRGVSVSARTGNWEADKPLRDAGCVFELMLGLKYQRFVSRAAKAAKHSIPMWIVTQPHDSAWFPTGVLGMDYN